jgi:hypothetical protein
VIRYISLTTQQLLNAAEAITAAEHQRQQSKDMHSNNTMLDHMQAIADILIDVSEHCALLDVKRYSIHALDHCASKQHYACTVHS